MIWDKHHQSFDCRFQKGESKLSQKVENCQIFLRDLKSRTNYLSFETNPRVLAQFVEKWHAVKDSYFKVQRGVKK